MQAGQSGPWGGGTEDAREGLGWPEGRSHLQLVVKTVCPQSSGKPLPGSDNLFLPLLLHREATGRPPLCASVTCLPSPPLSFPPGNSAPNGLGNLRSPPQSGGPSGLSPPAPRDPVLHGLEPVTREPPGDHGNRLDGGHKTQSTQRRREETLPLGFQDVRLSLPRELLEA